MNPNYTKQVKEEIDRLLAVGFIYPISAWSYADMEGIDPSFYQHWINLKDDAAPV